VNPEGYRGGCSGKKKSVATHAVSPLIGISGDLLVRVSGCGVWFMSDVDDAEHAKFLRCRHMLGF